MKTLLKEISKNQATIIANDEIARPNAELVELLVFLFLIAPSILLSFFVVRQGNLGFVLTAIATILRDLSLVALVLFFCGVTVSQFTRSAWECKIFGLKSSAVFCCLSQYTSWLVLQINGDEKKCR